MAFKPIGSAPSGFTPLDEAAASRLKPPLTVAQILAEGHAGEIIPESQPFAAFSRGALNSALAGTTEAAGTLSGASARSDPSSPQFTNPALFSTGEIAGSFIPVGRLGQAGKGMWRAVKEGLRLGGIYGAGQGVSKAVESENPTVSGAIESGLTEGAKGAALGAAIPAVVGSAIKLMPTKQNILDDLTKVPLGDEGKLQRSYSGGYVQAADKIVPFLKKEEGVPGFIEASEKALEKEAATFKPIIKNAPPVDPYSIYTIADQELAKLEPNPDTRKKLLLYQGEIFDDLFKTTNDNILEFASKANREVGRIYKNPSSPITSSELAAKEAIRDAYGIAIRNILEQAGQDPNVYSGYGAIREMASSVSKNYLQQSYKLSQQKGRSIPQNIMTGLETGGGGLNVGRAIENVASKITEGEKGRLDRQTGKLIDGLLGFKTEKTDAGKAQKLNEALKALNLLNRNQADPLTTIDFLSEQVSEE